MNSANKYKICWVTSTFLLDVDVPIVPELQKYYDIDWIILTNSNNYNGDKKLIEQAKCLNYRLILDEALFIMPQKFFFYRNLVSKLKGEQYTLYYFDHLGMPYLMPIVQLMLPKEKVIIAAHNVKTPKGARYYLLAKIYMNYIISVFKNFQVFSENQYDLLRSLNKSANIFYAPLCLKDYGKPSIVKPENPITFLFFGNIVEYKRLDILLKAVRILKEKGVTDFKVQVSGYCRADKWKNVYEPLLDGLSNLSVDIRRIPNELIPNLFENSHYFVMPYQDIAQSGAMTVALCYNIPIIASRLDTFNEFMDGTDDGYYFEPGNEVELADVMHRAILNHKCFYKNMREAQARRTQEKLSLDVILNQYRNLIHKLCK